MSEVKEYHVYTDAENKFIVDETENGGYRSNSEAFRAIAVALELRDSQVSSQYYRLISLKKSKRAHTKYTEEQDREIFEKCMNIKGRVKDHFKKVAKEMGLKPNAVQARFYDMAAKRIPRPEGFEDFVYNYRRNPSENTLERLGEKAAKEIFTFQNNPMTSKEIYDSLQTFEERHVPTPTLFEQIGQTNLTSTAIIEAAIQLLKNHGYKIMAPVTEWKEL